LNRFKTQELIDWKDIQKNFENELKNGTKDDQPTNVFHSKQSDGTQVWNDFKTRIVEHVSREAHAFAQRFSCF
jgi:hypothetical protein